eukprot:scaffold180443_cov31-Tisochrysis_lutea.AAC.3
MSEASAVHLRLGARWRFHRASSASTPPPARPSWNGRLPQYLAPPTHAGARKQAEATLQPNPPQNLPCRSGRSAATGASGSPIRRGKW